MNFVLAGLALYFLYHLILLGGIDPHNLKASTKPLKAKILAVLVFGLILFVSSGILDQEWVPVCSMFILAQTVALPLTAPDQLREDEESSGFSRFLFSLKSSFSGSIIIKVISIVMFFVTSWLLGTLWFLAFIVFGIIYIWSKGITALLLVQTSEGEFEGMPEGERMALEKQYRGIVGMGVLSYILVCPGLGYMIYESGGVDPFNWTGWAGFLGGVFTRAALAAVIG